MHTARSCPRASLARLGRQRQHGGDLGLDSDEPGLGYGLAAPFSRPAGTGDLQPGRPAGDYRGISVVFARFRAASASALLTAVLALGAAPSLSAQGQAPSAWVFDYVNFVTRADGWVMATNETGQNSFTKR